MSSTKAILRSFSGIALSMIATLSVFALVLGILWAVIPQTPGWKLVGALIAAALGLSAGGFVISWSFRAEGWFYPAGFGLLFGGLCFTYILGPNSIVMLFAGASALAALMGAHLYRSLVA